MRFLDASVQPLPPPARIALVGDAPTPRLIKLAGALALVGFDVRLFLLFDGYTEGLSPIRMGLNVVFNSNPVVLAAAVNDWQPTLSHLAPFSIHRDIWEVISNLRCKIILDPYDYHENCLGNHKNTNALIADDRSFERKALARADGLLARDLSLWNFCRVNGIRRTVPTVFFPDYCNAPAAVYKAQPAAGPVRIAWVGSVMFEAAPECATETGAILITRALAQAGCEIHFYPHITNRVDEVTLRGFLSVAPQQIKIHRSLPPGELVKEIAQYDFGVHLMQSFFVGAHQRYLINGHERYQISARCFDYLQAGLPMLTNPEFVFRSRYFSIPGFMVPLNQGQLDSDPQSLVRLRAQTDRAAICRASQRFHIMAHLPRLLAFYGRFRP